MTSRAFSADVVESSLGSVEGEDAVLREEGGEDGALVEDEDAGSDFIASTSVERVNPVFATFGSAAFSTAVRSDMVASFVTRKAK